MKATLLICLSLATAVPYTTQAKGCHPHTMVAHHHCNPYSRMRQLSDSVFTGYAVTNSDDTLRGTFQRFNTDDVQLLDDNQSKTRLHYHKIKVLHLVTANGPIHLTQ